MMKKIVLLSAFMMGVVFAFAQYNVNCYRIYLHDKAGSPYSIERPQEFLSQRCLDKRSRYFIPVTEQDIPVNASYISQIQHASATLRVLCTSRWMNTVVVWCPDTAKMARVRELTFVDSVKAVGYYDNVEVNVPDSMFVLPPGEVLEPSTDTLEYGDAYEQIAIHNGQLLHNEGFTGEGMLIAMLDAGWLGFDRNPFFNNLYENGQIWGTYNFVPGQDYVYWADQHGTACASIILSNIKVNRNSGELSTYVGTAPSANMVFIRTEDSRSESPVEEDYWVAGAELADSLGADVITSSLGYTQFDDTLAFPMNHSSLDGLTSIASRAATLAAHKGMVVCVAAGNEGNKPWHRIGRPSDAEDILAVGAVDVDSVPGIFTSYGPSYDDRVKPDVASVGVRTQVVQSFYLPGHDSTTQQLLNRIISFVTPGNGTSFACPCLAGLATCLWQAMPQYTSLEIMQFIREAGHQYLTPDSVAGYGIPDIYQAYLDHRQGESIETPSIVNHLLTYPNPFDNQLNIVNNSDENQTVRFFDFTGKLIMTTLLPQNTQTIVNTSQWSKGIYFLYASDEKGGVEVKKIICR